MLHPPDQLVLQIHAAPLRGVLAVTGGGQGAVAELLRAPAASRTILEATVPYGDAALAGFLGGTPERGCSAGTARAMAMAAFQRAVRLDRHGSTADLAGIACTADLAGNHPARGAHRAYAAVQTSAYTLCESLELAEGDRTAEELDSLLTTWLLNLIARTAGYSEQRPLSLLPGDSNSTLRDEAQAGWSELLLGALRAVRHGPDWCSSDPLVFPGAFNPLHAGHRQMAEIAGQFVGSRVEYEISIENVDKPPLDFTEMTERLAQFDDAQTVWFTRLPTFVQKARTFPGATFVVGADTIARIANPRYYGDDAQACAAAVAEIASRGCRFLVFGRQMDGDFRSLSDLQIPVSLRDLCQGVPPATFRADISSTGLREAE